MKSQFKFVVLKIQLNNPSKNRCYMEVRFFLSFGYFKKK